MRVLRCEEISGYNEFLGLRVKWNELLQESENNAVFLTWEWLRIWWEVFGSGKQLKIVLAYTPQGKLAGAAPFMIRRKTIMGFPARSIEFIGSGNEVTPDHLGIINRKGYKSAMLHGIFAYLKEDRSWDVLCLKDMREDGSLTHHVRQLTHQEYHAGITFNGICPYIRLPRDWNDYLHHLSPGNRYNIGRKERNIERQMNVHFSLITSDQNLNDVMERLRELHIKRMSEKKLAGPSVSPEFWEFHRRVAREFLDKGWLLLGVLEAGAIVVACQYAFMYGGSVSFYQSGIEPDFNRYSVGLVSTASMIRESIRRGAIEYDFLRGSEEYKFRWTKEYRRNMELTVWNKHISGHVLRMLSAMKTTARKTAVRLIKK